MITNETERLLQELVDEAAREAALEAVRGPGFLDTRELTESKVINKLKPQIDVALRKIECSIVGIHPKPMTFMQYLEIVPRIGTDGPMITHYTQEISDLHRQRLILTIQRHIEDPEDQNDYDCLSEVCQEKYGGEPDIVFEYFWARYNRYLNLCCSLENEEC